MRRTTMWRAGALVLMGSLLAACDQQEHAATPAAPAETAAPADAAPTAPANPHPLRAEAVSAALREKVVTINEAIIRDRAGNLTEKAIERFINATVNELSQCSAFRVAQALRLKGADDGKAQALDARANDLETHLYLFVRATGNVYDKPELEDAVRKDLKAKARTLVERHVQSMSDDATDAQAQQFAIWDVRCDRTETALKSDIERRARALVTEVDVEAHLLSLAAEPSQKP